MTIIVTTKQFTLLSNKFLRVFKITNVSITFSKLYKEQYIKIYFV